MPKYAEKSIFLAKLDAGIQSAGISPSDLIVCAISGGPDSTALLLGLKHFEDRIGGLIAAHYNHRARGQESDGDEQFVRQLCEDWDIALHVGRSERRTDHLDEHSARNHRYRFLGQIADDVAGHAIVVAHTIEDQAETVLFRLARGSGLRGASAMRPRRPLLTPSRREIAIVRPMLKTTRPEVQEFLDSLGVTAQQDSSNDDWNAYSRNRIRHRIMPELQAINTSATTAIARFADILQLNSDLVNQLAIQVMDSAATESETAFQRMPIASSHPIIAAEALTVIYRRCAERDVQIEQSQIDKLLSLISTGKSATYHLPGNVTFSTNHEHISMNRSCTNPADLIPYPRPLRNPIPLSVPDEVNLGDGYTITSRLSELPTDFARAKDGEAWLRKELFQTGNLTVRNRVPSDRFNPLGMNQSVELSKFLINSKIAASWRDRVPIVVHPDDGRIVWLPGIRIADWAKVSPNQGEALHLKFQRNTSSATTD